MEIEPGPLDLYPALTTRPKRRSKAKYNKARTIEFQQSITEPLKIFLLNNQFHLIFYAQEKKNHRVTV
jgi:hypothetical protein